MKSSSRILASLLLASGLAFATTSMAEHRHDHEQTKQCPGKSGMGMMGGGMMGGSMMGKGMQGGMGDMDHKPPFLRGIDLTEEQRDKIFEITYAQIPVHRTFRKEMHKLQQQMHELPLSADYDAGKMKKLVDAQTKLQGEHMLKMADAHNKIYKLLTDEQRKELAEHHKKD